MSALNIRDNGRHVVVVHQYLLQSLFHILIQDRNKTDLPKETNGEEVKPISEDKEQALRYVALRYIHYITDIKNLKVSLQYYIVNF